jgi:hypothetical protein
VGACMLWREQANGSSEVRTSLGFHCTAPVNESPLSMPESDATRPIIISGVEKVVWWQGIGRVREAETKIARKKQTSERLLRQTRDSPENHS